MLFSNATDLQSLIEKNMSVLKSVQKPTFPRYDVSEDGNTVTIEVACAGFKENNLSASIKDGFLKLVGKSDKAEQGNSYLVRSLTQRDFSLSFPMYVLGEVKGADCTYEDGIFKLVLSKKAEQKIDFSWKGQEKAIEKDEVENNDG
jgi:HSP20 family molecular chaperone IbpA